MRRQLPLSLGTIVNVRGDAQENLSDSLGTFLGYFLVRLAADKDMSLAEATRRVAAATAPIKARRAYLDSLLNMKLASTVWPCLRTSAKSHFMRRAIPLTAGVSNVVVRDGWIERAGAGCITECVRGASTGPIAPLVLTPTTLGQEMNVGASYRLAGFPRRTIDGIMEMFLEQIEHPTGTGHDPPSRRQRRWSLAQSRPAARRRPAQVAIG